MIKKIWSFFFGKSLLSVLSETRSVRVNNIKFKIRKVNVLDYLAGNKVLLQTYDVYKTGLEGAPPLDSVSEKKIREHYAQVIVAGVVHPKFSHKEDSGEGIYIEKLFIDWDLVTGLYNEIMILSYGKKKVNQLLSQGRKS